MTVGYAQYSMSRRVYKDNARKPMIVFCKRCGNKFIKKTKFTKICNTCFSNSLSAAMAKSKKHRPTPLSKLKAKLKELKKIQLLKDKLNIGEHN